MAHLEDNRTEILMELIKSIGCLQYGDYEMAECLYQKTKMLAPRFFENSAMYLLEINQINFLQLGDSDAKAEERWNDSHIRLSAIVKTMLTDVQLPSGTDGQLLVERDKIIFATLSMVILSTTLWSFNAWVHWRWLTNHPKRTAIYLVCQLLVLFFGALSLEKQRKARFVEWVAIAVAIVLGMISLLN